MRTTLIFLACLLVIAGASIEKQCNEKAEEIAAQDCKEDCNVAKRGKDCATCIWNHKDYDKVCQGDDTIVEQCGETIDMIYEEDCKGSCKRFGPECDDCILNYKDLGLACWTDQVVYI